ncbi:MAG TPA: methyltransferase domain-containing protein [Candidatus Acidoferrales bacterium]|nr:methyltransferase domain-containing protein [Candidatus Acidoferrales bacterium]
MATEAELRVEERIFQLVQHLGLKQAHFAAREFEEFDGLARVHPEIISSLTLVCPPRTLKADSLRALGDRLLCFYGGKGPNAAIVRESLATLPEAMRLCLQDYLDFNWADIIADHTDFIGTAMLYFLSRIDQESELQSVAPASSEGEVAGIRYRIQGSGPPLVLLPLVLAPSQWEPLQSRLSERYCTVVLGGAELGGVRQLEARGRSVGYRRVLERFLTELELKPSETILEVGCGSGVFTRLLAQRTEGANSITGLDINRYFLGEASLLARKEGCADVVEFREGSAENLPFADNSFDVGVSVTVTEECDAERMVVELARVTRPGGRVGVMVRAEDMPSYVNAPVRAELKTKMEIPRGNVAAKGCADGSLYRRFSATGLSAIKMFPQLATFRLDEPHGKRMEAGIVAALSDIEAEEWRAVRQSVDARELFFARPFHCAVGTKRVVS